MAIYNIYVERETVDRQIGVSGKKPEQIRVLIKLPLKIAFAVAVKQQLLICALTLERLGRQEAGEIQVRTVLKYAVLQNLQASRQIKKSLCLCGPPFPAQGQFGHRLQELRLRGLLQGGFYQQGPGPGVPSFRPGPE